MLSRWVEELRDAKSVEQVVSYTWGHFKRMKAKGELPLVVADHAVDDAEDIREIAHALARQPFLYNAPGYENDLDQQLLILFSLATDRLAQLEERDVARRSHEPVIRAS
ncbi:MAG: hypothetical protein ACXWGU_01715 [Usitatibacter sp.]